MVFALIGLFGVMSCSAENAVDEELSSKTAFGQQCTTSENLFFSGFTVDPIIDVGGGRVAIQQKRWTDAWPLKYRLVDVVKCGTGQGLRYKPEWPEDMTSAAQTRRYYADEEAIGVVFDALARSSRGVDTQYLLELGRDNGVEPVRTQAAQSSIATKCGCALHYPQTETPWVVEGET